MKNASFVYTLFPELIFSRFIDEIRLMVSTSNRKFACPICSESMVKMDDYWRDLDEEISVTPMPDEYANMKVNILCRDCHKVCIFLRPRSYRAIERHYAMQSRYYVLVGTIEDWCKSCYSEIFKDRVFASI